ncbi:PREDICTED: cytochrome c oxidase assembly factor 3 homolog, mitochondrial, partial [Ficedula albicollis]|uniref:cytochrome c oxidase assembly factor 3 homolog, mitochondrial n=1 Tax=Ficedula albicollis TaxID=59894 RepID=UPI0007AD7F55
LRCRDRHALGLSQPLDAARRSGPPIGQRSRRNPREPGEAAFARRIDPSREPGLSPEQRRLIAQVEYAQRQRVLQRRLRSRNVLLALGIGAVTFGIYGYTFYSVSQERFLDELEQ